MAGKIEFFYREPAARRGYLKLGEQEFPEVATMQELIVAAGRILAPEHGVGQDVQLVRVILDLRED